MDREYSGMSEYEVKLAAFARAMRYKLELRQRRPPDPAKWPVDGVDAEGRRDWLRCSPTFLRKKIFEELSELVEATISATSQEEIAYEAADVALVAFMIAERAGVCWTDPVLLGEQPRG